MDGLAGYIITSIYLLCHVCTALADDQLCWKAQDNMILNAPGKKLSDVGIEHCEFCCLRERDKSDCVAMNYDATERTCSMLNEDHRDGEDRIYKENAYYIYLEPCSAGMLNWIKENKLLVAGGVVGGVLTAVGVPYLIPGVLGFFGFTATGIVGGSIAAKLMAVYGGKVAAGSLVAALQSIGTAGTISSASVFVSSLFGAGVGGLTGAAVAPTQCTVDTCPCDI